MAIKRREFSWKLHGTMSYTFSRDTPDDPDYETFSGTVATPSGMVTVHGSRWIDDRHEPARSFTMAYRGRMFSRSELAPIFSQKHGAYLAGKFARDVVAGRVR